MTLCSGIKNKSKGNANVIPDGDLELGYQFIGTCKKVGFTNTEIAKRYIISEFNRIRNSSGGKEAALEILKSITLDDIREMRNSKDRLVEDLVISHFEALKERHYSSKQKDE
jgi:hypothetical protein